MAATAMLESMELVDYMYVWAGNALPSAFCPTWLVGTSLPAELHCMR